MLIISLILLAILSFLLGMFYVDRRDDPEQLLSESEKEALRRKLRGEREE